MEPALERLEDEKVLLERELNELFQFTYKMEYELELVLKKAQSQ